MITFEQCIGTEEQVRGLFMYLREGIDGIIADHPKGYLPALATLTIDPFTGETHSDISVLAGADLDDRIQKKRVIKSLAAKVYKDQRMPVAVAFASEAWMLEATPENEAVPYLRLADHPQRIECITLSALGFHGPDEPGVCFLDMRKVARDSEDRMSFSSDWQADLKPQGPEGKAYILESFFDAYLRFAMKYENPADYLHGMHVEQLR